MAPYLPYDLDGIAYPSFFWGCAAFDRREHDQGKPHRASLREVVNHSLQAMTDKEIEMLREKLTVLGQMWMERVEEPDNSVVGRSTACK